METGERECGGGIEGEHVRIAKRCGTRTDGISIITLAAGAFLAGGAFLTAFLKGFPTALVAMRGEKAAADATMHARTATVDFIFLVGF